jgi:psp operon transcriptional activator
MEQRSDYIGQSTAFLDSVERASRAAALNRPILVIGERGTGKELVAERLHRLSPRWEGPLVTLNCAALTETLIEAELFGHEAGAFTGATRARAGRFEEADGGTLFLDELALLSAGAQERLLRAVEYGEVTRIGANRPVSVDVRVVAATNVHLPDLVKQGAFRADLLDRLAFEVITLPPLREREGDLELLADHFGRRMAAELDWPRWAGFSKDALVALMAYAWPGNVRELRNVVERAVYRWDGPGQTVASVHFDPFDSPWKPVSGPQVITQAGDEITPDQESASVTDFKASIEIYERQLLIDALTRTKYNQRSAAKLLNLSYDQLRHALKRHKII